MANNIMKNLYDKEGFLKGKPDGKGIKITSRPNPKPSDPAALHKKSKLNDAQRQEKGKKRMGL